MNKENLVSQWKETEQIGMKGWDFSYLKDQSWSEKLPWSYRDQIVQFLNSDDKLLDMGTGGGEFLSTIPHPFELTSATESWEPNISLIRSKLEPKGIHIYPVKNQEDLPDGKKFNMIINSHTSYDPQTVADTLEKDGIFITQQVGSANNYSLSRFLDPDYTPAFPENTAMNSISHIIDSGLKMKFLDEYHPQRKFYSVNAVVYYASNIPWEFPHFTVDGCLNKLFELEKIIQHVGYISTHEDRFIIIAQKN